MEQANRASTPRKTLGSTVAVSLLVAVAAVSFSREASSADITPDFMAAHPWCYPASGVVYRVTYGPTTAKSEKFSRDGQQKISLTPFENGWNIEKDQANRQVLKIYSRPPDLRYVKQADNGKDINFCVEYGGKTYAGVMLPCTPNTDTIGIKIPASTELPDKQCK